MHAAVALRPGRRGAQESARSASSPQGSTREPGENPGRGPTPYARARIRRLKGRSLGGNPREGRMWTADPGSKEASLQWSRGARLREPRYLQSQLRDGSAHRLHKRRQGLYAGKPGCLRSEKILRQRYGRSKGLCHAEDGSGRKHRKSSKLNRLYRRILLNNNRTE